LARFVHDVHMRWSDMDAYRHINNSAYLAYLEQARVAMFFDRSDDPQFAGFSGGTVISRHEIDYLLPVVYHPEPLRLELWISDVRAASFLVHYEVFDGPRKVARASTQCVTFDFTRDVPRRLTPDERAALAGFADDADADADDADDDDDSSEPSVDGRAGAVTSPS
jgi:acyl-CoA thioester hydrolase